MANQGYSKLTTKEKQTIRLFKKFVKCKNANTKTQHNDEYELQRNWMKERKQKYFNNYFQNNVKNIKNT